MIDLSKKKIKNGINVFEFLVKKLKNPNFNFVDVGARNGSFILPENYAKYTTIYGFEPNQEEYTKLINNNTDAKNHGIVEPEFKEKKFFNTALFSKKCKKKLFITKGPGACTLMGKVDKKMTINLSRSFDKGLDYFNKIQKLQKTEFIDCDKLDNIYKSKEYIDFLKIDVEGAELDVLEGAKKLLKTRKILMIKSEFFMTPYYKKHILLGHQQVFLDKLNYRLIYIDNNHGKYSWKPSKIIDEYDNKFSYAGDAYFMLDPDLNNLNNEQKFRLGMICLALQFNSTGLNFLDSSKILDNSILRELEVLASNPKVIRKLTIFWKKIPAMLANLLKIKNVT